jgi:hypothetical protein
MSLEDFPEFDQAVQAHLDGVVEKLASEFGGIHEPEHVRGIVDGSARACARGTSPPTSRSSPSALRVSACEPRPRARAGYPNDLAGCLGLSQVVPS